MANCNLAQAAFVARLADEYLDGMLSSRALTKPFVDACLNKLYEVRSPLMLALMPLTFAMNRSAILQRLIISQIWMLYLEC